MGVPFLAAGPSPGFSPPKVRRTAAALSTLGSDAAWANACAPEPFRLRSRHYPAQGIRHPPEGACLCSPAPSLPLSCWVARRQELQHAVSQLSRDAFVSLTTKASLYPSFTHLRDRYRHSLLFSPNSPASAACLGCLLNHRDTQCQTVRLLTSAITRTPVGTYHYPSPPVHIDPPQSLCP